jgi:hypothetical protein
VQFAAAVKDLKPVKPALVSIQIQAQFDGQTSGHSIDPIDGDTLLSPTVQVPNHNDPRMTSVYKMYVNKSATLVSSNEAHNEEHEGDSQVGPELYNAWFACLKASGKAKPGITWKIKQDQ